MDVLRYSEPTEQASEYLRLTFSMLGEYKLTPNPINFAVCYEYISGNNQPLSDEFDQIIQSGDGCSNYQAGELFQQYIWDDDKRLINKLRAEFITLLVNSFDSIAEFESSTSISSDSLAKHTRNLIEGNSVEDIQKTMTEIIQEVRNLAESGQSVRKKLDETKTEIDVLKNELEQTRLEATTDPLTGLKNRRSFEISMKGLMRDVDPKDPALCLLMIDIDHFKKINDSYGHVFGDKVLKSVAAILLANVKGRDIVSRIGGEEFAVLLPDTRLEYAKIVAENLRAAVESAKVKKIETGETLDTVTVSVGITCYKRDDTTDILIDRADKAMYKSKNEGRNRVSIQL